MASAASTRSRSPLTQPWPPDLRRRPLPSELYITLSSHSVLNEPNQASTQTTWVTKLTDPTTTLASLINRNHASSRKILVWEEERYNSPCALTVVWKSMAGTDQRRVHRDVVQVTPVRSFRSRQQRPTSRVHSWRRSSC